ncbi:hypothetical protein KCP71_10810 [Salmonella enterica subsp. enterica]|nr:hypothetical protein KCP71_10810 [Salmonella enterica subsp. enterica]
MPTAITGVPFTWWQRPVALAEGRHGPAAILSSGVDQPRLAGTSPFPVN